MPSLLQGYEYDIFISYRHNDNLDGWVTEFVQNLEKELRGTIKDPISIYFDTNPHDGLLETHNVDKSLEGKLKCLIFIPIISQTYCDPKSFAWQQEFCAFNNLAKGDTLGRDIKLGNGNVASRILPIKIHDLDAEDKTILENELGGVLRAVEFIYKSAGVNRPLRTNEDHPQDNLNKTFYRDQINKVANAVKEIIAGLQQHSNPAVSKKEISDQGNVMYQAKNQKSASSKQIVVASLVLVGLLACGYFIYRNNQKQGSAEITDKSIAVIPFVNMSDDPEQEFFSDGLTEELITQLSSLHDLLVISRSSAMTFKGTKKKIGEIAHDLNVRFVLEGSVRKSGKKLLITAQLIDANTDAHLWGEKYNGNLEDVFDIQEKVARSIVEELRIKLTPEEDRVISKRAFDNVQAFECYMRARRELLKFNVDAFDRAKQQIQNGLNIIGPNATLFGGMAYVYFSYANLGFDADKNWKKADEYVRKTFELDPQSPEGHFVLGLLFGTHEGKIKESIQQLNQVLALRPNDFDALFWLGVFYPATGNFAAGRLISARLTKIDPLSASSQSIASISWSYQGRFDLAVDPARKSYEMEPESSAGKTILAIALVNIQHPEGALELIDKTVKQNSNDAFDLISIGFRFAIKKDKAGLQKLISNLSANATIKNDWQCSHWISEACALAGMDSEALFWLENSVNRGFINYPYMSKHSPAFKNIRNDIRFQKLMERVKTEWKVFEE